MLRYQYRMVQISPTVTSKGAFQEQAAAAYLMHLANENAVDGWEFWRLDEFNVHPGFTWFNFLFKRKEEHISKYYVVTFRKELH